jgi:micrococcal nuclease
MKNIYSKTALALIASFILFHYFNHYLGYPKEGVVKYVIDGDTIILNRGKTIRLLGLNTAETKLNIAGEWVEKESLWGERAYIFLKNNLEGKRVRIEYDREREDIYKRLLGYIFLEDKFINKELLRKGLAVIDVRAPNFKYLDALASSFKEAKESGIGFWSDLNIIPPGDCDRYEGEIVAVRGDVIDIYNSKELLFFLLPSGFKFVIFKGSLPDLDIDALLALKDKTIAVTGMVKKYRGSYQMVIHHLYQLEVLK